MFRWIAILAAVALAIGVAYGQSSQTQPTLPLGQSQMMGHMNSPMRNGGAWPMNAGVMQMMQMMASGPMGPGTQNGGMGAGMTDPEMTGPMCRGQMAAMGMMGMTGSPASRLEARLAFARSELAINDAQDAAWQAYATMLRGQVKPNPTQMDAMYGAVATPAGFAAIFDARITLLEGRLASLKAVREATVELYDELDDEQRQKADTLLPMSSCI
jgi:hypothetical protein